MANKKMQFEIDLQLKGYGQLKQMLTDLKGSSSFSDDMKKDIDSVMQKIAGAGKQINDAIKENKPIDADSFGINKVEKELTAVINKYVGGLAAAKNIKTEGIVKSREELELAKQIAKENRGSLQLNKDVTEEANKKIRAKIEEAQIDGAIQNKKIKTYQALEKQIERMEEKKKEGKLTDNQAKELRALKYLKARVRYQGELVKKKQKERQILLDIKSTQNKAISDAKKALQIARDMQIDMIDDDDLKDLNKAIKLLEKLGSSLHKIETSQQKKELKDVTRATKGLNKADQDHSKTLLGKVATGLKYYVVLNQLRKLYTSVIKTVTELDEALTQVAMVTSMNRKEAWGLLKQYQNLAREVGMTTTAVAELSIYFFRQGRSARDAMEMTKIAAKAAKVAAIDATESANYLTSAINGFGLAASQAEGVADRFAALGAASASSYEELAIAMSKVAPAARVAGIDIDHMMGFLAKGIETTREAPENIGTAFKTIFSRMRQLKDIGKTMEDGMDVNKVETALRSIGVQLRDSTGMFRDLQDVINETGIVWDTLNTNQQAYIGTALAGTRQQARLLALFQDYDRTLELVAESQNAAGQMAVQHAEFMEGMGAAITGLKTSWQEFITSITESGLIIGLINTLTMAVDILAFAFSNFSTPAIIMTSLLGLATVALIAMNTQTMINLKTNTIANIQRIRTNQLITKGIVLENAQRIVKGKSTRALIREIMLTKIASFNKRKLAAASKLNMISTTLETSAINRASKSKAAGVIASMQLAIADFIAAGATGSLTATMYALASAIWAVLLPLLPFIAAAAALIGIATLIYRSFTRSSRAIKNSAKEIRTLNKELAEIEKKRRNITKLTEEFDKLNKKIKKTPEDLEKMKSILNELKDATVELDGKEVSLIKGNLITGKDVIDTKLYEEILDKFNEDTKEKEDELAKTMMDAIGTAGADAFENSDIRKQYASWMTSLMTNAIDDIDNEDVADNLRKALARVGAMLEGEDLMDIFGRRKKGGLETAGDFFAGMIPGIDFLVDKRDDEQQEEYIEERSKALAEVAQRAFTTGFTEMGEIDFESEEDNYVDAMIKIYEKARKEITDSDLSIDEQEILLELLENELAQAAAFKELAIDIDSIVLFNLSKIGLTVESIENLRDMVGAEAVSALGDTVTNEEIVDLINLRRTQGGTSEEITADVSDIYDMFTQGTSGEFAKEIDDFNDSADQAHSLMTKLNDGTITAAEAMELKTILGEDYNEVLKGNLTVEEAIDSKRIESKKTIEEELNILNAAYADDTQDEYYLQERASLEILLDNWDILNTKLLTHTEQLEEIKNLTSDIASINSTLASLEGLGLEDSALYQLFSRAGTIRQAAFDQSIGERMGTDVDAVSASLAELESMGLVQDGIVLFDPDATDEQMAVYDTYQGALDNLQETSDILLKNIKAQAKAIESSYKKEISAIKTVNSEKWKTIQYQDKLTDLNEKLTKTAQQLAGLQRDTTQGAVIGALQAEQEKLAKQKQKMIEDQLMADEIARLESERDMQIQQLGEDYVKVAEQLNTSTDALAVVNNNLKTTIEKLIRKISISNGSIENSGGFNTNTTKAFLLEMG